MESLVHYQAADKVAELGFEPPKTSGFTATLCCLLRGVSHHLPALAGKIVCTSRDTTLSHLASVYLNEVILIDFFALVMNYAEHNILHFIMLYSLVN